VGVETKGQFRRIYSLIAKFGWYMLAH